ncbi:MAG: dUTP diphosphatase [Ornithinimicrobium sp.]
MLRRTTSGPEDLCLPTAAHPGDAGLDLRAASTHEIAPGERVTVDTGIAIALPHGFAAYVLPRSGLAARHGITVLNSPGTVDAGYRGEIRVTLLNTDRAETFRVHPGDRIAQMVVQPVQAVAFTEVQRLPGSARGERGHGSTGGFGSEPASDDTKG